MELQEERQKNSLLQKQLNSVKDQNVAILAAAIDSARKILERRNDAIIQLVRMLIETLDQPDRINYAQVELDLPAFLELAGSMPGWMKGNPLLSDTFLAGR